MMQKKIIIVDDHPLMRAGLGRVVAQSGHYTVVAEAANGENVMSLIETLQPDLLMLDLGLPVVWQDDFVTPEIEKGGFVLTRDNILHSYGGAILLATARSRFSGLRIVVVTQYEDPDIISSVIRAGADGFVLKADKAERILEVVDRVISGEQAQSDSVQELLAQAEQRSGKEITPREKEVLELIANGFRDRDIAERLEISLRTVAFHKANLKDKVGAETLAELVAFYHNRVGL